MTSQQQLPIEEAIRHFDTANSADPNRIDINGQSIPYELFYAQQLSNWVRKLRPDASPALLLASRCQHLCRWEIPRNSYPLDRAGYLKWRTDLKSFHAQKSGEILRQLGFPEETIERVQTLNLKKNLAQDPEVQVLEDALCLVTLQHQLGDLMHKTEKEKMISILQKTWKKMSPLAHQEALKLPYPPDQLALIQEALAGA
jgi:hypothetical protein